MWVDSALNPNPSPERRGENCIVPQPLSPVCGKRGVFSPHPQPLSREERGVFFISDNFGY
jgi:hypothetical protein